MTYLRSRRFAADVYEPRFWEPATKRWVEPVKAEPVAPVVAASPVSPLIDEEQAAADIAAELAVGLVRRGYSADAAAEMAATAVPHRITREA